MSKVTHVMLLAFTLFSFGCAVQRQSKFTSDRIKPGMTKKAVIALYGKPYKESVSTDANGVLHEDLYYKEQIFIKRWYEINNILHFENAKLKSLEQGDEELLHKDAQVITK